MKPSKTYLMRGSRAGGSSLRTLSIGLAGLLLSTVACSDSGNKVDNIAGRGGAGGSSSGTGGAGRGGGGGSQQGTGGAGAAGQGGAGQAGQGGGQAGGGQSGGGQGGGGTADANTMGDADGSTPGNGDAKADTGSTPGGLAGYKYSKVVKLDTTAAGANVTAAVEKYPLALVLNTTNFDFMQAKEKGEDVRFTKADGTPLPHAIELWDRATTTAAIWVKLDQVLANDNTQSFVMHWGNADATDGSDTKAVFPQAEGFVGVYHLDEEGNTTANGYKDASSHEAHATGLNLMANARVDGRIGKATNLSNPAGGTAAARWIRMNEPTKLAQFNTSPTNAITISIWTKATSYPTSYCTIMSKGDTSWTLQRIGTSNQYEPCHHWGGASGDHLCAVSNARTAAGQWVHLAATFQEPKLVLYVNGVVDKSNMMANWDYGNHAFGIGNQTQFDARRYWDGVMDEARVMRGLRSPAWFKLDFESQREGQKLVSFGPVQMK
ncbi:MAG TPA: DUF2341 domain-containing protein [Polyangia bacterium]